MASPKRIVALDLGTQSVSLAEFRSEAHGSLVLQSYRSTELQADPAHDATRHSQVKFAVQEMVSAAGLKGQPINYAIAAQSVFTRFVKLPSVGEEQVEQIVSFEAQQNVPYPIDEVVWDYQLVETGDSAQVEVVIVAIKSDLLDEINESVEAAHLTTTVVDVSPMALFNAFRYNYSDVTDCALIIDIGARTTNLVFIEPNKVFSRSISSGGNTITAAIAKEFHEPFGAAEERKRRDGFVSLGGAYADPDDPEVARVSKITRNTMTRLHAEISRSISFYRAQQAGAQPSRVFLAGATTSMPYMREFFQEKFQLPVEFFNPLRNVTVSSTQDVEEIGRKAHTFGGLVGLALRSVASCPMELNLRPAGVIRRQIAAKQKPAFVLAAICLLAGLTAWWMYYDKIAGLTNDYTQTRLQPRVQALQTIETKMKGIVKQTQDQQDAAQPLLRAVNDRDYWVRVINDINTRLPEKFVWITSFEPEIVAESAAPAAPTAPGARKPGQKAVPPAPKVIVKVSGLYAFNPEGGGPLDTFIQELNKSDFYSVDPDPLKNRRTAQDDTSTWAFEYGFQLVLKNPLALTSIPAPSVIKK
ncbi:MAG TPA: type IV pilus assembly protein PilM [Chthoniobacteraceae bacterium]|jgi:type IV pilus assembly protein PilM|nr:type IV pilus assembly protein PilM [Chthoniobacteraceae bacterium]